LMKAVQTGVRMALQRVAMMVKQTAMNLER
jgi:hypothetical protein